jgi:hypothetical protein
MAGNTIYSCSNVGRVIEANVGFFRPTPDAFPGDVLTFFMVTAQFLDLRMIDQSLFMATPACPNIRNRRPRPTLHGDVAIHASQFGVCSVDAMDESNRLLGFG